MTTIHTPDTTTDLSLLVEQEQLGEFDFSLDEVCDLLRAEHGLLGAYVEQTGGGIATIYAGATYVDEEGEERQIALAGPGYFRRRPDGTLQGIGSLLDFAIGTDDQGATYGVDPVAHGATTPADFATIIAAQVALGEHRSITGEEVRALGFTGTAPAAVLAENDRNSRYATTSNEINRVLHAYGVHGPAGWAIQQAAAEKARAAPRSADRARAIVLAAATSREIQNLIARYGRAEQIYASAVAAAEADGGAPRDNEQHAHDDALAEIAHAAIALLAKITGP